MKVNQDYIEWEVLRKILEGRGMPEEEKPKRQTRRRRKRTKNKEKK